MFDVLSICKPGAIKAQTWHAAHDRRYRLATYATRQGRPFVAFVVDTGHSNGLEEHIITTGGYVLVVNRKTRKLCTVLAARPAQVLRYFDALELDTSQINKFDILLDKCRANVDNGLNEL